MGHVADNKFAFCVDLQNKPYLPQQISGTKYTLKELFQENSF
jgi:hypothetical protein